jgi:hypothetical protein
MARSIWTGVISFGLVSVPVAMYSATREHEVSFHQFEKGTSDRIRYQRVNERTGKEVDYGDIVKGADVGGGDYVMLDPDELDEIAPGRSRSLDILRFVDLDEIDPIYYQKTYYLEPASDETAKTYALLCKAMAEANRAAIATLVMRGKEYLAAIRPDDDLLVLETGEPAPGGAAHGDPAHRVDGRPVAARGLPRQLHRTGAGADRGQGQGPRDQPGRGGARSDRCQRPDGGAAPQRGVGQAEPIGPGDEDGSPAGEEDGREEDGREENGEEDGREEDGGEEDDREEDD